MPADHFSRLEPATDFDHLVERVFHRRPPWTAHRRDELERPMEQRLDARRCERQPATPSWRTTRLVAPTASLLQAAADRSRPRSRTLLRARCESPAVTHLGRASCPRQGAYKRPTSGLPLAPISWSVVAEQAPGLCKHGRHQTAARTREARIKRSTRHGPARRIRTEASTTNSRHRQPRNRAGRMLASRCARQQRRPRA
jgi:hypothetical protein